MVAEHHIHDAAGRHLYTPMLLETVQSKKIDPTRLINIGFKLDQILDAYDTIGRAAEAEALKVIITA